MNKLKLIFEQTLMISTGILFGLGIEALIRRFCLQDSSLIWQWYIPLSIILTGFLCSVPSILLLECGEFSKKQMTLRKCLHCISIFIIVSFSGWLFHWYTNMSEYIPIAIIYIFVYFFVWIGTGWIYKVEENKINAALLDIQDEE